MLNIIRNKIIGYILIVIGLVIYIIGAALALKYYTIFAIEILATSYVITIIMISLGLNRFIKFRDEL